MKTRILSAAALIPIALGLWWIGGAFFGAALILLGGLMIREWQTVICGKMHLQAFAIAIGAIALSVMMIVFAQPKMALFCFLLLTAILALLEGLARRQPILQALGLLWFGGAVCAAVWLREIPEDGATIVLWLLLVAWCSDSGAYFVGRAAGGPKLAPRISPKKTWSGFLGGAVAAAAVSFLIALYIGAPSPAIWILAGLFLAAVGQIGDLLESLVKRRFDVKDSGDIIPGHGGILDRVDALSVILLAAAGVVFIHGGVRPGWL